MINKSTNSKKIKTSKIFLILVIFVTATLLIYFYIFLPTRDTLEKNKYISLSQNINNLYLEMVKVSKDSEVLVHKDYCETQYSGPWPTGMFYCKSSIELDKQTYAAEEIADVQERYFAIVDEMSFMKPKTDLEIYYPDTFGKKFIVSGTEKTYETSEDIECRYSNDLYRDDSDNQFDVLGEAIGDSEGRLYLIIECSGLTHKSWFE